MPRYSRRAVLTAAAVLALSACAGDPEPSTSPSPSDDPSPSPSPTPSPSATPSATPTSTPEPTPEPAPLEWDIDSGGSLQVIVNKRRPLNPPDYAPQLVAVSIAQDGDELVRPEVDAALVALDQAQRAAIGEGVFVFSSYRSYATQTTIYQGFVNQYGQAEADTTSARPGHSEHQTGLAVDVVGTSGVARLSVAFASTPSGQWLAANAWQHGFVVRYPNGLEGITGYEYEPWHLRFVGVELATAMTQAGAATLEEYLALPAAPDYG
ncbi:M15 family metallopeptidase [Agrococcus jejuensis]|uniref:M15 family metallopeptidase n=1 Tax=Agrococcus jejuensis TaxID=399736 RepID=UPI0011A35DFD|nr:M15 family metallopeptidase [Agrococcus jejuensis]